MSISHFRDKLGGGLLTHYQWIVVELEGGLLGRNAEICLAGTLQHAGSGQDQDKGAQSGKLLASRATAPSQTLNATVHTIWIFKGEIVVNYWYYFIFYLEFMGHAPSGILLALTAICDKSELRVLCAIFVFDFDFDFVTYYIHFSSLHFTLVIEYY